MTATPVYLDIQQILQVWSLAWAPAIFKGNLQWTVGVDALTRSSARHILARVIDRARTGTRTADSGADVDYGAVSARGFDFPAFYQERNTSPRPPKSCPTDGSFNRQQHFLIKVHSHTQLSLVTRPYWKQLLIFTSFLTATVIDVVHIFWGSIVLFRVLFERLITFVHACWSISLCVFKLTASITTPWSKWPDLAFSSLFLFPKPYGGFYKPWIKHQQCTTSRNFKTLCTLRWRCSPKSSTPAARRCEALAVAVFLETDVKVFSSSLFADLMAPDKSVKAQACVIKRSVSRLQNKNKHASQGGRHLNAFKRPSGAPGGRANS